MYKFETLGVWELSLEYVDMIYRIAAQLPETERYNLYSQFISAGTSITLNIAEGSTGQSDKEQGRFLGMAIRSLLETVACLKLIERRDYITKADAKHSMISARSFSQSWSLSKRQSVNEEQSCMTEKVTVFSCIAATSGLWMALVHASSGFLWSTVCGRLSLNRRSVVCRRWSSFS